MIPSLPLRVLTRRPRGLRSDKLLVNQRHPRSRVSLNDKPVARYNLGRSNKSLDASRTSGLLIDNLRVTQLRAAASTPPLGRAECCILGDKINGGR